MLTFNYEDNNVLKTALSCWNAFVHILMGVTIAVPILFAVRKEFSMTSPPQDIIMLHIILGVLGYQLLMAEAILSLSPSNSWSAHLKLVDKRRAHWILQILGSGLAIVGSIIKILDKDIHWNTLHGQFALVALVFTVVSLVNGVAALWAYEWRKFLPGKLSKLSHICFGVVGFAASAIALCYGIEKGFFRSWTGNGMAYTLMGFIAAFTFLIIVDPMITFVSKLKSN